MMNNKFLENVNLPVLKEEKIYNISASPDTKREVAITMSGLSKSILHFKPLKKKHFNKS